MKTFKKLNVSFLIGFVLMIAFSSCQKEQIVQQAWQQHVTPLSELPEGANYLSFETEEEANEFFEKAYSEIEAMGNNVIKLESVNGKDAPPNLNQPCDGSANNVDLEDFSVTIKTKKLIVPDHTFNASSIVFQGDEFPKHFSPILSDHFLTIEVDNFWVAWTVTQDDPEIEFFGGVDDCHRQINYTVDVTFKVFVSTGGGGFIEFENETTLYLSANVFQFN